MARSRSDLAGRRAAHAPLAVALGARRRRVGRPRRADPRPAAAGLDRPRGGFDRGRARAAGAAAGDARGSWALAQVPLNIAGRGLLPGTQALWLESAPSRARGRAAAGAGGRRPLRADDGRRAAGIRRPGCPESDRLGAVSRVRLRAVDGGARGARATSPRRCACSTGCARCCATSSAPPPRPTTMAVYERLLRPGQRPVGDDGRASGEGPDRVAQRARRPRRGAAGRTQTRARTAPSACGPTCARPGAAPARGQRQGRAPGGRSRDRQDAPCRCDRQGRLRRRRFRARGSLARGGARSLSAVSRGAAPLRPQRAVLRAPGKCARIRDRAGPADPRAPPEGARSPAAGRRRAGDRALPPV